MNSSITVGELAAALKTVLLATKRSESFILGSVLLRKTGLVASNFDWCCVTCKISLPVEACLERPHLLLRWLNYHDLTAPVEIETLKEADIERIRFSVGSSQLALNILPANSFPELPEIQPAAAVTMPALPIRAILQGLLQTAIEQPGAIGGIYLQRLGNRVEWIACNRSRLMRAKIECLGFTGEPYFEVTLPKLALRLLQKCQMGAQLEIAVAGQWAILSTGATRILVPSKGNYPSRNNIPPNSFGTVVVDRKSLIKSLNRCAPKAVRHSPAGRLWLIVEVEATRLIVEGDTGREALPCKLLGTSFALTCLDSQHLLGALRNLKGSAVYLQPGGGEVPTIVRALDATPEHVVAGMRIACKLPLPADEAAGAVPSWRQLPEPKIRASSQGNMQRLSSENN